jgi:hypothetical protein
MRTHLSRVVNVEDKINYFLTALYKENMQGLKKNIQIRKNQDYLKYQRRDESFDLDFFENQNVCSFDKQGQISWPVFF